MACAESALTISWPFSMSNIFTDGEQAEKKNRSCWYWNLTIVIVKATEPWQLIIVGNRCAEDKGAACFYLITTNDKRTVCPMLPFPKTRVWLFPYGILLVVTDCNVGCNKACRWPVTTKSGNALVQCGDVCPRYSEMAYTDGMHSMFYILTLPQVFLCIW